MQASLDGASQLDWRSKLEGGASCCSIKHAGLPSFHSSLSDLLHDFVLQYLLVVYNGWRISKNPAPLHRFLHDGRVLPPSSDLLSLAL